MIRGDGVNFVAATVHSEMNPRKRSTMEDCHRLLPDLDTDKLVSYFGVYDGELCALHCFSRFFNIFLIGHGGRGTVEYLEEHLEKNVARELSLSGNATIEERMAQ